jgi:hypothetical protein
MRSGGGSAARKEEAEIIRFPTPPWNQPRAGARGAKRIGGKKWHECGAHSADGEPLGMTWDEIGKALGISNQRAQQIAASGMVKLIRICKAIGLGLEDIR